MIIQGTKENIDFTKSIENTPIKNILNNPKFDINVVKKQNEVIDNVLNMKEYQSINSEFSRLKRKYDVPWYKPWGVSSVYEISDKLGRKAEYNIFYSNLSEITHSHSINQHVTVEDGKIVFENVRNLQGVETVIRYASSLGFRIYRKILEKYSPAEIENFRRKYVEEWRTRFKSIKTIEYKNIEFTLF